MLLHMSLAGALLIAIILLLRRFAPSLPPRFFVVLWDITLARLLLPIALPLSFGLQLPVQAAAGSGPGTSTGSPWLWIWLAGAAAAAIVTTVLCLREWDLLRDALPLSADARKQLEKAGFEAGRRQVLVSDRISTPVAAGLFRPRIVLPKSCLSWDARTMRFALTHELVHIRRYDNLQKLVMMAAVCVQWFNPLVWIMHRCFDRDLERSCDERVIQLLGETNRFDYAETLVDLAAQRDCLSVCGSGFGRSAIHERILSLLRFRKLTAGGWAAAAVCLALCSAAFAVAAPAASASSDSASLNNAVYTVDMDTGVFYSAEGVPAGSVDLDDPHVSYSQVTVFPAGDDFYEIEVVLNGADLPAGAAVYSSHAGSAG